MSPATDRRRPALLRLDETTPTLRRGLGSPAVFAVVQGFSAASLYFSLGLVIEHARGLTWLVLLAAALFFVLLLMSYAEGTSLYEEPGGATKIARYGFNELWSFVAGWAIALDYVILVAITAMAAADYLGTLWDPLSGGLVEGVEAAVVVVAIAVANLRGITVRAFDRAALLVLGDLVVQVLVVGVGLVLVFDGRALTDPMALGGGASTGDLVFAFTVALIAYAGIDASASFGGNVTGGSAGLRRTLTIRLLAGTLPYVGIALVAVSVLPAGTGAADPTSAAAPVVGLVRAFDDVWLRTPLEVLVAVSAVAALLVACNSAMLAVSKIGVSLARHRQIPSGVGRLHPRFRTPFVVIGLATLLALVLVATTDVEVLAGVFAFGATLAFTLVHLSIISLRFREPRRPRAFVVPFGVRVGRGVVPAPAALGALLCFAAWIAVLWVHPGSRTIGMGWLVGGVALYVVHRRAIGQPIARRVSIPETSLVRGRKEEVEFGSILVPVLGGAMDDDIMQTAGRLAGEENEDQGEGGAVIEALWIFELPLVRALDAEIPDEELRRARAALARAKAVGEEYEGVEVATATVRARQAGEAIVHEARRRGVEAIVLAAEEPTRVRGGARLGGRDPFMRDEFVGSTTRYVVRHAPCRVILTASPPSVDTTQAMPEHRLAPPAEGDPTEPVPGPIRPTPAGAPGDRSL